MCTPPPSSLPPPPPLTHTHPHLDLPLEATGGLSYQEFGEIKGSRIWEFTIPIPMGVYKLPGITENLV